MTEKDGRRFRPPVARSVALTDGIFAIAMTILVLSIEVPDSADLAGRTLGEYLLDNWVEFFNYALSFILLGVFWIIHHKQMEVIRRFDGALLWLNIIGLMFVCLIPFSTSLMGEYGAEQVAAVLFEANMMAIGLFFFLMWAYATKGMRLVDAEEVSPGHVRRGRRRNLVIPGVSAVAIAISFISPDYSTLAYIAIPVILRKV